MNKLHIFTLTLILTALAALPCLSATAPAASISEAPAAPKFTMQFPKDFTATNDSEALAAKSYFPVDAEDMVLGGYYSGKAYANTNFSGAIVAVTETPAESGDDSCTEFDGDTVCKSDEGVGDVIINAIPFKLATIEDAAVGHRLEARKYWTIRNGHRFEVLLSLSYTDMGAYTPGTVKEFDKKACWEKLVSIMKTFSFPSE
ncbi:hypothetical protein [Pseudodesulfovibrio sp.]|uniref:hypothetical protein n=1 Tax=unclassified Pseudodesulfovibrio TaxID=2661612 RepID=UPI003B007829